MLTSSRPRRVLLPIPNGAYAAGVRILIFHGYLLGGTGSNVYNARLAEALVNLGHEVHLLCQDRRPYEHSFVDATGTWSQDGLVVAARREPRCTVYRPDIGMLLPVYVADRYEGMDARPFTACTDEEIAAYVEANVAAVRDVLRRHRFDLALANHAVMGPLILARALSESAIPYIVKVHGSALEYTVKAAPERFVASAREGLDGARTILVGSRHTARSLWRALADPKLEERTRAGPPGVDVHRFGPRPPEAAAAALTALAARLAGAAESVTCTRSRAQQADAFAREERSAALALGSLEPLADRLVCFVGKLIVSKGVDLLVAAWPLVLAQVPDARLVLVGFGAYGQTLERLVGVLAEGDLEEARAIARAGRALEAQAAAAEHPPLGHLLAFLDGLRDGPAEDYRRAAAQMGERVVLTGRLEHSELAELLPACSAQVVPSTFPESFGMVAVEAAACGALPISAAHSGLAEVSEVLAAAVPEKVRPLLSFPVDDHAVHALAERLIAWLGADPQVRGATRAALVDTARARFSWEGVARTVVTAATEGPQALAPLFPGGSDPRSVG